MGDRLSEGLWWMLLSVTVAVIAMHPYGPTNDASSHIATAWIARRLVDGDLATATWYAFDLLPMPYWTPTLLMAPVIDLLGPFVAWQALMVLTACGFALAVRALLAVSGPGNRVLSPLGALLVFNHGYYLGEAAYLIGLPLAFGAVAVFARLDRFGVRWAVFALMTVLTALSHVFALAILVGGVGCLVVTEWLGARGDAPTPSAPAGRSAARWTALGVALLAMAGAAWWVLGHHGTSANSGELVFDMSTWRLRHVVSLPMGHPEASLWPPLAAALCLGLLAVWALKAGRSLHPAFALSAVGCFVLAWLGPAGVQEPYGFEDIGQRFAIGAVVFGLAAVRWPADDRRLQTAALVVVVAWAAWKVPVTWQAHAEHQARVQTLRDDIVAHVPRRAMVLPLFDVETPVEGTFAVHRLVNHVVFEREAYSPHVFARTGQQPLRHVIMGDYRRVDDLEIDSRAWRRYDHVLVQTDATGEPRIPEMVGHTREIARSGAFRLYEVVDSGE